jgi:hypothetical protein
MQVVIFKMSLKMNLKMRLCQKIQELSYQESMIAKRLEEYLLSAKPQDKIIQESQGGNFISNMDHTIYVPTLFIK